jgi:outer membrane protein OmpA-like peptidoglycan-associated protein
MKKLKPVLILPVLLAVTLTLFHAGCKSAEPIASSVIVPPSEPEPEPEPAVEEEIVVGEVPLVLSASYEPQYFSPDNDGENDELFITLGVEGGDIALWSFDILQPEFSPRNGQVLKHFEGTGIPDEKLVWNGRGDPREVQRRNAAEGETRTVTENVQSATDYPYAFTVTDSGGNVGAPVRGIIHVDILVSKTNDGRLQIRVPSIVFRSNAADFKDLPERTVRNNNFVISRIAASLNKFGEYKVLIEGHANPENAPGTKARTNEETKESKKNSVSEKRAEAILSMLVENGVSGERMTAVGLGISRPVVDFEDKDNAWQNRRVEFYLEK